MNRHQQEDEILETLADNGSLHVMKIAQEVDSHPIAIDRVCTRLYDTGHIHRAAVGIIGLPTTDDSDSLPTATGVTNHTKRPDFE